MAVTKISKEDAPLNVAFIWHMHQPYYKDPLSEEFALPWVRLHGLKDYYNVVALLDDFPDLHQTFNLTPSLLEQIKDYTEDKVKDKFLTLTLKKAEDLSAEERFFVLKGFFQANWDNMIDIFPRYKELLKKRGGDPDNTKIRDAVRYFTDQDFLDLQVLFNLAWINPLFLEQDTFFKKLKEKGRDYAEKDKVALIDKSKDILKLIIPKYADLQNKNIIELSTTPYYHPILPLLCDTHSAKEPTPHIALPNNRFSHPEDAQEQIRMGVDYFKKVFGYKPKGMWPSEGSVSEAILPLMRKEGIKWFATDEGILSKSLNHIIRRDGEGYCTEPEFLYKGYSVGKGKERLSVLFRDHLLSDLIGFVYSKWQAEDAASDLTKRLQNIRNLLQKRGENPEESIVTIILDGENPWEYYKNNGRDFLVSLFTRCSKDKHLKLVTVSEFFEGKASVGNIERLSAGSWINSNFNIWIGHPEDNTAYDHLYQTRRDLFSFENSINELDNKGTRNREVLKNAWKNIYIAEGSDWNWWYGDDHYCSNPEEFDELFRNNLKMVYKHIDKEYPTALDIPIITEKKEWVPSLPPLSLITPQIDGLVSNYFEWLASGRIDREHHGGAMHQIEDIIKSIYFGFDLGNAYFRLDIHKELIFFDVGFSLLIRILEPQNLKFQFIKDTSTGKIDYHVFSDGEELSTHDAIEIASDEIVELKIPFSAMSAKKEETVRFFISLMKDGAPVERWPSKGYVSYQVPTEQFDLINWYV
jgi:alpha-amylase/alpha-mannosidase (GH57 family)